MDTVYILGAGASKALAPNAPLNDELLSRALELPHPPVAGRMIAVGKFIADLYPDTRKHLPPLEDVLSQLDLAINEGRPLSSKYTLSVLHELRDGLVYGIAEVLRKSLEQKHATDRESERLSGVFVMRLQPGDTLISLNYDIIFDNALLRRYGQVGYGIGVRSGVQPQGPQRWTHQPYRQPAALCPLYKPHGSLNWLYCRVCQKLDVTAGLKSTHYIFDDPKLICPECQSRYEALIVAPTMFKSYSNPVLAEIWRAVEDRLARADEIVFAGYSLPDADVHLRCILTRTLFRNRSRSGLKKSAPVIRVLGRDEAQPEVYFQGPPNAVHARYQRLFGEVDFDPTGFVPYIQRGCKTYSQTTSKRTPVRKSPRTKRLVNG